MIIFNTMTGELKTIWENRSNSSTPGIRGGDRLEILKSRSLEVPLEVSYPEVDQARRYGDSNGTWKS